MRKFLSFLLVSSTFLSAFFSGWSAQAAKTPVIGKPDAPTGGTFYTNLDAEPSTLHPLRGSDAYGSAVTGYVFDTLLGRNPETREFEPALAEKWEVSKDGKTITFKVRQGAKFTDGSPITLEDIKFSFEANMNPKLADAVRTPYFENIEKVEITGPDTLKFTIKKKYFNNLAVAGGFEVLPKAVYGDPAKKMNKTMVGSGPYMLEKYDQGKNIILKRNPDWWGYGVPLYKGYYKAEKIHFRFIREPTAQLEMLKKGELDFLGLLPEQYEKKTDGPPFGVSVFKKAVQNNSPKGTGYLGFNLKKPIFADAKVRKAMSMLLNRDLMIQKFLYNKALPATGPWYQQNPYSDPAAKSDKFDPPAAKKLLAEAGWTDSDKDGLLDKMIDGRKVDFRVSILNGGQDWEKYLTVYREELKKAGIELNLKVIEWNALQKALDDRDFEMCALAWGGQVEPDPKQVFHSSSAVKGGSNYYGYANAEVDKLIEQAREELNEDKRKPVLRKIYRLIAEDRPYLPLWNRKFEFYAHTARMQMAQPTYRYEIGTSAWWIKE